MSLVEMLLVEMSSDVMSSVEMSAANANFAANIKSEEIDARTLP